MCSNARVISNTSLTPELVTLTTELANAFAQSRKVVSARARIGLFYRNPEATDLFRKVNEYCIAPPEADIYSMHDAVNFPRPSAAGEAGSCSVR